MRNIDTLAHFLFQRSESLLLLSSSKLLEKGVGRRFFPSSDFEHFRVSMWCMYRILTSLSHSEYVQIPADLNRNQFVYNWKVKGSVDFKLSCRVEGANATTFGPVWWVHGNQVDPADPHYKLVKM